ncbi:hypothetical protein GCM10023114_51060 [Mycolicibacterium sediminis]|uniref:Uncharacterized protein n=1 Tax=Mycolicibacterium sediminis TaxID=1286180 RepID=A0A7I7QLF7_9MYCO|nr:hypothetical protein MSEDJ_12370 [Mycolicibacterium sediminis]
MAAALTSRRAGNERHFAFESPAHVYTSLSLALGRSFPAGAAAWLILIDRSGMLALMTITVNHVAVSEADAPDHAGG